MKKHLLTPKGLLVLVLAGIVNVNLCAQTAITNGGFENWENVFIMSVPDSWEIDKDHEAGPLITTQVTTEATEGSSSLKLTTILEPDDSEPRMGYAVLGQAGDSGPEGGIPWTETIDELQVDIKYNTSGDDAVSVLVMIFDDSGEEIGGGNATFTGEQTTWANNTSVPLTYSGTPAEILIGFLSSDYTNEANMAAGSWIQVDNVRLLNGGTEANTPIPNYSFENWSDFTINDPVNWTSTNMELTGDGVTNVEPTTDAYSGTNAAKLTNVLIAEGTDWEYVMTGYLTYGDELYSGYDSYPDKPEFLIGAYKYIPEEEDMGRIHCHFDDDTDPDNGILGNGLFDFGITDGNEKFVLPLNFWNETPTQYVGIGISAGEIGNAGSELFIDDLQFVNGYEVFFTVTNEASEPVSEVAIEISTYKGDAITTNTNGEHSMILPDGTYEVTATHKDYGSYTGTLTIDGGNVDENITLPVATSMQKTEAETVNVFPNPANDKITLSGAKMVKSLKITNMSGKVVKELITKGEITTVNISDIPAGQYILSLQTENESITRQFIIAR